MDEVDREINELNVEKRESIRRRLSIFEALDIPCELKYEFGEKDFYLISRKCKFYIEVNGYRQNYVECNVYYDVNPADIWMRKIPEKYKCDFIMLWQKAHKEDIEWHKKQEEERNREWETFEKEYKKSMEIDLKTSKDFYKQCYRVLAKSIHPDTGGDLEAMQYLNQLKSIWGV